MQVRSHGESSTPSSPSVPPAVVSALIVTSETPKRIPAAVPSITPWCSWLSSFFDSTRKVPSASSADSKTIIAARE